jgi:hypothetical protein
MRYLLYMTYAKTQDAAELERRYVKSWQKQLRRKPTLTEQRAMKRAAELQVICEKMRHDVLTGVQPPSELVRIERLATRAAKDVQAAFAMRPEKPAPMLSELMEGVQ